MRVLLTVQATDCYSWIAKCSIRQLSGSRFRVSRRADESDPLTFQMSWKVAPHGRNRSVLNAVAREGSCHEVRRRANVNSHTPVALKLYRPGQNNPLFPIKPNLHADKIRSKWYMNSRDAVRSPCRGVLAMKNHSPMKGDFRGHAFSDAKSGSIST